MALSTPSPFRPTHVVKQSKDSYIIDVSFGLGIEQSFLEHCYESARSDFGVFKVILENVALVAECKRRMREPCTAMRKQASRKNSPDSWR
jgi:hypothetical protein